MNEVGEVEHATNDLEFTTARSHTRAVGGGYIIIITNTCSIKDCRQRTEWQGWGWGPETREMATTYGVRTDHVRRYIIENTHSDR